MNPTYKHVILDNLSTSQYRTTYKFSFFQNRSTAPDEKILWLISFQCECVVSLILLSVMIRLSLSQIVNVLSTDILIRLNNLSDNQTLTIGHDPLIGRTYSNPNERISSLPISMKFFLRTLKSCLFFLIIFTWLHSRHYTLLQSALHDCHRNFHTTRRTP